MTNITTILVIFGGMGTEKRSYRVVVLHWKSQNQPGLEIFSNLKILTTTYPQFNYNTLNNYISKRKIAYDTDTVRIERKNIITKKIMNNTPSIRKISAVVNQQNRKTYDEKQADLKYWLQQSPAIRVAAVTSLIQMTKKKNQRLDKTAVNKIYRRK